MSTGVLTLPPDVQERLEQLGLAFQAEFLGRSHARHPENLEVLSELATVLTRLGRFEEGLAADQRLAVLAPEDPTVHYNLACSLALLGRLERALDALERALALGYRDLAHLLDDPDLASLKEAPRFRALTQRLREK
ncbi:MAG: tetratricopeptide repeat protein [Planctomycetes bacterium]|nr:tetratricopeptide repeat protein [Planctomycetota bacterium]